MQALTKKPRTKRKDTVRVTINESGTKARVIELRPDDARVALRMLESLDVSAADTADSVPWREALAKTMTKEGGEVATIVKAGREQVGMTQRELAEALGIQQSNLSEIERGKRGVGKVLARKLGKALNTDWRVFL